MRREGSRVVEGISMSRTTFSVNGREYIHQGDPVVVICIDGSEPAYHEEAIKAGRMPWLKEQIEGRGTSWGAHCAIPTLTNPNNMSIATGHPPAVHGICGNYILDPATGEEVLMSDPKFQPRCPGPRLSAKRSTATARS